MKILIAEDDPVAANVLEDHLQTRGYESITASDGKQALKYLENQEGIEMVISEVMMPGIGGLELLGKIKDHPEWKKIPVIMCTSRTDINTIKRTAKLGCRYYLVKPVKPDDLFDKIDDALGSKMAVTL